MKARRWDVVGGLAGLALGAADTALLLILGVEMSVAGRSATLAVGAIFGASFAALGFLIGRLVNARARAKYDADTIERQLVELEVRTRPGCRARSSLRSAGWPRVSPTRCAILSA